MLTVSVVIPTLDRPNLLLRALRSVFNQTYPHLDVIVVLDRPSEETIAALRAIEDPRLRVIFNPRPVNAPAARNLGADHAKGDWVAFLDDDDEWLPEKIEKQLSFGLQRGEVLVSCLSRIVTPHSSYVVPQRVYDNETRLDEYLFDPRPARAGEGFLQTSSFMMPRSLFEKVRFYEDRLHDDWDFVLRLSNEWKIRIETVPEELTILYVEEQRPSLTSRSKWRGLAHLDRPSAADDQPARLWRFLLGRRGVQGGPGARLLCVRADPVPGIPLRFTEPLAHFDVFQRLATPRRRLSAREGLSQAQGKSR